MESNAEGLLERKSNEIHALENTLQSLDEQVEDQLVKLDNAREAHETARANFGGCLTQ